MASSIPVPTLGATDLLAIGDKLGGTRIDNAIERARHSSIPLQGAQSGGWAEKYMHLSAIPLFPLYHSSQNVALAQQEARKQERLRYVKPPMEQDIGTKVLFTANSLLTGGVNPMSIMKWENRLQGVGAVQMQKSMEQTHGLVFTRWTVPYSSPASPSTPNDEGKGVGMEIWFLDVLEWKASHGCQVSMKIGKKEGATIGALGKTKALKSGKTWSKRYLSSEKGKCESVAWVKKAGKGKEANEEVEMEIVARIMRPCSSVEARASLKVFEKEWVVPVVVVG